jgi:hypothetical protein
MRLIGHSPALTLNFKRFKVRAGLLLLKTPAYLPLVGSLKMFADIKDYINNY